MTPKIDRDVFWNGPVVLYQRTETQQVTSLLSLCNLFLVIPSERDCANAKERESRDLAFPDIYLALAAKPSGSRAFSTAAPTNPATR